ncbi:MAG: chromate transporter [Synechococcaceae cyanobacterium]|nr:chromate transporter [Synechococcaceae cyanobacterium]
MTLLFAACPAAAATATAAAASTPLTTLAQVVGQFLSLSLFSLGGGNTLLAEYHHLAVDTYCWLSDSQFADLYALAEAAPGPSSMIVGLLGLGAGWRHGPGWALLTGYAAELAILLPSTLLMVAACLSWKRLEHSPWRVAFERGLGPVTLGILFAVGLKIVQTADHTPQAVLVSLLVCALMLRSRLSPLLFMAVAGVLGGLGLIQR